MERTKLVELMRSIADANEVVGEEFCQNAVTFAVAAKRMFENSWAEPIVAGGKKNVRSKVAAIGSNHVHDLLGVTNLRGRYLDAVSDFLREAYSIDIIRHPFEDAYLMLWLDKMRFNRAHRNVWVWPGSNALRRLGKTDDAPEIVDHITA